MHESFEAISPHKMFENALCDVVHIWQCTGLNLVNHKNYRIYCKIARFYRIDKKYRILQNLLDRYQSCN